MSSVFGSFGAKLMFVVVFGAAIVTILAYARQAGQEFAAGCREVLVELRWVWAAEERLLGFWKAPGS